MPNAVASNPLHARPFDINVAYDIRHYQQVKYGNVIDPYFPAVGTDEAFKVLEGEVLMQTNNLVFVVMVIIKCMFSLLQMDSKGKKLTLNASAPGGVASTDELNGQFAEKQSHEGTPLRRCCCNRVYTRERRVRTRICGYYGRP